MEKSAPALLEKSVTLHKKIFGLKHFNSKRPLLSSPRVKAVNK
jgi:hypothetical protein